MIPAIDLGILSVIILISIVIACYSISGVLFIRQSFKYAEEPRVKILAFIGSFLVLVSISRFFHPILYFLSYELNHIFYISQGIFIAAIIMLVFYLERVIYTASHYIFTIILVIGETLFIISEIALSYGTIIIAPEFFSWIVAFVMASAALFMGILYIRIAIQSSGEARRDAICIIIGGLLFALSYMLAGFENETTITYLQIAIYAAPLELVALPFLLKGFRLSL